MNRCIRLLLGLSLLLLVVASLLHPSVHWRVIGWWRGEAFYQGRPTSYWANEIETSYRELDMGGSIFSPRLVTWYRVTPSCWHQVTQPFMPGTRAVPIADLHLNPPLLDGNPDALVILLTLIQGNSARVRRVAICGLMAQGQDKPEISSALLEATKDPDEVVRREATAALE